MGHGKSIEHGFSPEKTDVTDKTGIEEKPVVQSAIDSDKLRMLIVAVVADKTGYPAEMIQLEMNLEADLGIDSIKRVEILSELQAQIPELATAETGEMATLATLAEILQFSQKSMGHGKSIEHGFSPEKTDVTDKTGIEEKPVVQSAIDSDKLRMLIVAVVADKTGYPAEMIQLEMNLEADLGIDSIKRVEILSELQTQIPELAAAETGAMASLATLAEILHFAVKLKGASAAAVPSNGDSLAQKHPLVYEVAALTNPASCVAPRILFAPGLLYLVPDNIGVAEQLKLLFHDVGVTAEIVEALPAGATRAIWLGGLNRYENDSQAAYTLENEHVFHLAARLGQKLVSEAGLFITVQDTGGSFCLNHSGGNRFWRAGATSLIKTAAKEWPEAVVRAIDIASGVRTPADIARALFDEIITGGPELEVGLGSDNQRMIVGLRKMTRLNTINTMPVSADEVVVVSGGARGVTAACMVALAQKAPLKIAILGRTPVTDDPDDLAAARSDAELKQALLQRSRAEGKSISPKELNQQVALVLANREAQTTLRQLTSLGSSVLYLVADVTDGEQVKVAVAEARQKLGPITILVHAAGVLADKLIHEKTSEQFQRVFATKVTGFKNLLAATATDKLHHICCFSSVTARLGNRGQSDYGMANEILNKACQEEKRRRSGKCLVKSINWGPWAGGMVNTELARHFEAQGIGLIQLEQGAATFVDLLTSSIDDPVEVLVGESVDIWRDANRKKDFILQIGRHSAPLIDSHRIQGVPVVPVMQVYEWFAALVRGLYPDYERVICRNMKVLKGIQLKDYDTITQKFMIAVDPLTPGSVKLSLSSLGDRPVLHYQATLELPEDAMPPQTSGPVSFNEPWPLDPQKIYDRELFHGPAFQAVRAGLDVDRYGCRGEIRTPNGGHDATVVSLDAGLQLALLWKYRQKSMTSLPTGFENLILYRPVRPSEKLTCTLQVVEDTDLRTCWNLFWLDETNIRVAEMNRLNMHVVPSSGPADGL